MLFLANSRVLRPLFLIVQIRRQRRTHAIRRADPVPTWAPIGCTGVIGINPAAILMPLGAVNDP